MLDAAAGDSFAFQVQYGGVTYFDNGEAATSNPDWTREISFKHPRPPVDFHGRRFAEIRGCQRRPCCRIIVLIAGLLIATLSSVLVRYVLVARLKAARLKASAKALAKVMSATDWSCAA